MFKIEFSRTRTCDQASFDNWRSLTIGIYMALAGYAVMVGLPVISTAWVDHLGFSEIEVGRLAGADLAGLAVGALVAAAFVTRIDRRHMAVAAAITAITANVMCTYYQSYEYTLLLRIVAGVSAGVFTGIAVATIAGHSRPAFAFGLELFAFSGSQGAELKFLPFLSMNGIYWVLAGAFAIGILFIFWLPRHPAARPAIAAANGKPPISDESSTPVPTYVPWLVLTAIIFTYINIGAYWTYIELAAANSRASADWVATMLWVTSVFSFFGCLFAVLTSNRFGLARPLLISLIVQASVVVMLVYGINNASIAISMFMFNFCWIFVDIFQAATVANVDRTGRFPALIPAAQGIGNFLGPNIAASILAFNIGYNGVFVLCGAASITAMLIYLYMYLTLRKRIPALADAS